MKKLLTKKLAKTIHLDDLTEATPDDAVTFLSLGLLTFAYRGEYKTSDHYLLRNDPWIEKGPVERVQLIGERPSGARYYSLGPLLQCKEVTHTPGTTALYIDVLSIAFYKPNEES